MNIIVVGRGKFVYFLARTFLSKGYKVTIINNEKTECRWLARMLKATVVHGEGSSLQILEEAGAETADAILAVTPNDQDNLVICQLADMYFHVKKTMALVNDPDNEEIFSKLGISAAFSTTRILSSLIEQRTGFENIINLIPISEGKVNVTEVTLEKNSPSIGQALKDIGLPESSLIASLMRRDHLIVPSGSTILEEGDKLITITTPENIGKVISILMGEENS